MTRHLSDEEYHATMGEPMRPLDDEAEPPFDFWDYFDEIPEAEFGGYDCGEGSVTHVYRDPSNRYEHVLVDTNDQNVFVVLVLDVEKSAVHGHHLLDLSDEYGLADQETDAN